MRADQRLILEQANEAQLMLIANLFSIMDDQLPEVVVKACQEELEARAKKAEAA